MLVVNAQWFERIDADDLPESLRHLVERAEQEGIADRGTCVRFAVLTGLELGGDCYPIPKLDRALSSLRRRMIEAELGKRSYKEIAHAYGVTERHVRQIEADRRAPRSPWRQQSLMNE